MSTTTHATHEAASPACLTRLKAGLWRLEVLVQPGARKSEPIGLHDGRARIRLAAPPVEGKANKALVAFVAKRLGLRSRQVTLERGRTSRRKSLLIESETVPDWGAALDIGQ